MTRANPLLTRKAVVRGAIEADYGVAESLAGSDGILVSNPLFSIDPTVLERDIVTEDLSPQAIIIGRKLAKMTFTTEFRGNSIQNSGLAADAPKLARLFRACGFSLTEMRGSEVKGPYDIDVHANEVAWAQTSGAKASKVYTIAVGNAADADTVSIGGVVYTWKTAAAAPYQVTVGGDATASGDNLAAAINGTGFAGTTAHPYVTAANVAGAVTVTAKSKGTWANSLALAESGTNTSWAGAATALSGGTNVASNTDSIAYYLEVTTGGASGAAEIAVTSDTDTATAAAVVTTATPFTIGTLGLTMTPTFTGNLAVGQRWVLWLLPTGLRMDPVSDGFESATLEMNKDGVLHLMPGSFGTFDLEAEAGQYGKVNFDFTGIFVQPTDAALTAPTYERTLPAQIELARLFVDDFNAIVAKFTYNQQNTITVRPDVSSVEGYIGTRITSRAPEGGIDPEAELVADHDFWGKLGAATRMPFQMRIGKIAGNRIWVLSPSTQYTGLTYTDRDNILTYDAGLKFSRYNGNDEICFVFC